MNKKTLLFGVVSAVVGSVIFVNSMDSLAGIGVGICFGIAFAIVASIQ